MSVKLNHTFVFARDKAASAAFVAEILGLPAPKPFGPFVTVALDNDVTLDFLDAGDALVPTHYAFHVGDAEFDAIFARIRQRNVRYWADPYKRQPDTLNSYGGGRGLYFDDPSGHKLEILTRPCGPG